MKVYRRHGAPRNYRTAVATLQVAVAVLATAWLRLVQPAAAAEAPDYRVPPSHHWDIRSSVQVSRDALREAYLASREAYTQKLQKYAKCSPQDAQKAVSAAHPGMKIENLQLRNIRTNLVYMAVVEDDEDKFLVIVDAGNCKVLLDRPIPTHHERVFAEPY